MDYLKIGQSPVLTGSVNISGAKNAALPLLFSTLLAEGTHSFSNVPNLEDVHLSFTLLRHLGCTIEVKHKAVFNQAALSLDKVLVSVPKTPKHTADYELVRKMRASILCLGPLLVRCLKAKVSLPGGCAIGLRPVDYHIDAFRTLGADLQLKEGYIKAYCKKKLVGAKIDLKFPSVGATENSIMAAVLAEGETSINNAALEPEVLDLILYLQKMGADIHYFVSKNLLKKKNNITINGVQKLTACEHTIIPDRIEAGTFLIAAAMTKGRLTLQGLKACHLTDLLQKLKQIGCLIEVDTATDTAKNTDSIYLTAPKNELKAIDIKTEVYPGFPTDLQAQWMAMMTQASGTSCIEESIFENRFMHIPELIRLGANIKTNKSKAFVTGASPLKGASVMATDLRAGSSLVLASLVATAESRVHRIYHLDRGYEFLQHKLSSVGAKIKRCR